MDECKKGPSHVRVLVIEDHDLTREGAKQVLGNDPCMEVVGEAKGSEEAISLIAELQPDVAILDIRLKSGSGIDVVKATVKDASNTKLLVLSAYDDPTYVKQLVKLGVHGYLIKTASSDEFIRAVHDVATGNLVFPSEIAGTVLDVLKEDDRGAAPVAPTGLLTQRETEVLGLMSKGLTNREIATNLGISTKTVEAHVQHLLSKLGVASRTQAVLAALNTRP